MRQIIRFALGTLVYIGLVGLWDQRSVYADPPEVCDNFNIDPEASKPFKEVTLPPSDGSCTSTERNGFPLPDPNCNPGAINPTITLAILKAKGFTTKCIRDQTTSAAQKAKTYAWYGLKKPKKNSGQTQRCELDHIIPLVLGGSDHLENLWPQCGPPAVSLNRRFFKQKDLVEVYLARQVRKGSIDLAEAQKGIAENWTQFLDDARKAAKKKVTKKKSTKKKRKVTKK
jgi:hypothetical protein